MLLDDLAVRVQDRLEEVREGLPNIGFNFWDLPTEIRPAIVEGMNEAALITAMPEIRVATPVTLNVGGLGGGLPPFVYAPPDDCVILLRIDAPGGGAVNKVFVCDLDRQIPGWEGKTGTTIKRWFPIGLSMFGVYPTLTAEQQVFMSYVAVPVPTGPPYSGTEVSPFRQEYNEAFEEYAAHVCRLKESGPDFQESIPELQNFQDRMVSLTKFVARTGLTRFTKMGRQAKINNIEMK